MGCYPAKVVLILVMVAFERYSFYAVGTVLFMYLTTIFHVDEADATSLYHAYMVIGLITAILGALISDMFPGKHKTILTLYMLLEQSYSL